MLISNEICSYHSTGNDYILILLHAMLFITYFASVIFDIRRKLAKFGEYSYHQCYSDYCMSMIVFNVLLLVILVMWLIKLWS